MSGLIFLLLQTTLRSQVALQPTSMAEQHTIPVGIYDLTPPQHTNDTCLVVLAEVFTGYLSSLS